ncbi:methyl-accepting chemotaxis protein [Desulfovibrio mangrovi]|uniref:methyl-accepting chemotaxis protein n=1 Tax=Desulfovibrio mangrovi TaxID=2976983 RepID=UPI002245214B|nr:methyl-accepting chemotaxis protein [Desulfovibrio mangrovi]UZP67085.1 methyl-accepting chemotaxis protein [Desulfovibrio mangrovi]
MKLGIRERILLPIIICIVLGMGLSSMLSYNLAKQAVVDAMNGQARQSAESLTRQLTSWLDDTVRVLQWESDWETYTRVMANQGSIPEDVQAANTQLAEFLKNSAYVSSIKITDDKGMVIASSTPSQIGKLNVGDRDYFAKAMKGQPAISDAILSKATGKPVVVVAVPARVEGKITGIFYGTVEMGSFAELVVDPVKLGQKGYAFIIARSGKLAAHPNKDLILKTDVSELDWGKTIMKERNGILEYSFEGLDKIVTYREEPKSGWIIGVGAEMGDIYASVAEVRTTSIYITAAVIAAIALLIIVIVRPIVGAIRKAVAYAETVAGGDLSGILDLQRGDELGTLADALRTMVGKLKEMIAMSERKTAEAEEESARAREATRQADEARLKAESAKREGMLQAAAQLETIVQRVHASSGLLADQIGEALHGSERQRERTAESATAMEEMNATVMEVARNASEAAEHAEEAQAKAAEGSGVVESVVKAISDVNDKSMTLRESLGELGQRAEGIGSVMGVISDIADQTNLLALNAAIEAARAGEAGRGFAVVADEVRKLAEKTMTATKEVHEAIQAIQAASRDNIRGMEEASMSVGKSTELATIAGDSLQAIVEIVQANADQVRAIATASEEQSAASEEISRGAEEVNHIALETADIMTRSSEAVEELTELAQELQGLIEELKSA